MVQSMNSQVLFCTKGECFNTVDQYGKLMLGNKAFEFYDDRNPAKNIQIPWDDIEWVRAVVYRKKYFSRFFIETKEGQSFSFTSQDTKKVLQTIAQFVDPNHIVHADTLMRKIKRRFTGRRNKAEAPAESQS